MNSAHGAKDLYRSGSALVDLTNSLMSDMKETSNGQQEVRSFARKICSV